MAGPRFWRVIRLAGLAALPLALNGCIVKTAADIATAPIRVGAKVVDLATTSQSERDRKRGRELRHREERAGRLKREYDDKRSACNRNGRRACEDARAIQADIDRLTPASAVAPRDF